MIGSTIVRSIAGQVNAVKAAVLAVLSASNGAGMVGFLQAGTGAVARNLLEKVREVEVSALDFMSDDKRAKVLARIEVDVTAEVQAAIDYVETLASRAKVHFPAGVYLISSTIRLKRGALIQGDGYDIGVGTAFKLAAGSNCTMFDTQTADFSQFHGMADVALDGNKANQTAGSWHGISCWWWDIANKLHRIRIGDCRGAGLYFDYTGTTAGNAELSNVMTARCDGGGIKVHGTINSLLMVHCSAEGNGLATGGNFVFENMNENCTVTLIGCRGEGRALADGGGQVNIDLINCAGLLLNVFGGYFQGVGGNVLASQIRMSATLARISAQGVRWPTSPDKIVDDPTTTRSLSAAALGTRNRSFTWNMDAVIASNGTTSGVLAQYLGAGGALHSTSAGSFTPEGLVAAPPGSLHTRTSGGAGGSLYVKRSGTGNTDWVKLPRRTVSAARGNADFTLDPAVDEETQYITAPLTSDRTITLGTATALKGDFFRVVRNTASTGAFTFSVGGLKALSTGQWADVQYNGAAWVLTASGAL